MISRAKEIKNDPGLGAEADRRAEVGKTEGLFSYISGAKKKILGWARKNADVVVSESKEIVGRVLQTSKFEEEKERAKLITRITGARERVSKLEETLAKLNLAGRYVVSPDVSAQKRISESKKLIAELEDRLAHGERAGRFIEQKRLIYHKEKQLRIRTALLDIAAEEAELTADANRSLKMKERLSLEIGGLKINLKEALEEANNVRLATLDMDDMRRISQIRALIEHIEKRSETLANIIGDILKREVDIVGKQKNILLIRENIASTRAKLEKLEKEADLEWSVVNAEWPELKSEPPAVTPPVDEEPMSGSLTPQADFNKKLKNKEFRTPAEYDEGPLEISPEDVKEFNEVEPEDVAGPLKQEEQDKERAGWLKKLENISTAGDINEIEEILSHNSDVLLTVEFNGKRGTTHVANLLKIMRDVKNNNLYLKMKIENYPHLIETINRALQVYHTVHNEALARAKQQHEAEIASETDYMATRVFDRIKGWKAPLAYWIDHWNEERKSDFKGKQLRLRISKEDRLSPMSLEDYKNLLSLDGRFYSNDLVEFHHVFNDFVLRMDTEDGFNKSVDAWKQKQQ